MHRRGNPTARHYHDPDRRHNLQPARRYYLTPDLPYISVSAARLDPPIDRGNNDRMERTMGAHGARVETPLPRAERRRAKSTFDSAV